VLDCDDCIIAGLSEHITPWMPDRDRRAPRRKDVIIACTGHIQTIVNPPGTPQARYLAGPEPGPRPAGLASTARGGRGTRIGYRALRR
jgi:polyhydroxyalkanoate synthase